MVLVQIAVFGADDGLNLANNGTTIPINIIGLCNIRIIGIQYHQTGAGTVYRNIMIRNDKLRLPTSQYPFPIFMTNSQANISFDQSHQEYHFNGVDMDGRLFIDIIDTATGVMPTGFTNLILSLDIEKLK